MKTELCFATPDFFWITVLPLSPNHFLVDTALRFPSNLLFQQQCYDECSVASALHVDGHEQFVLQVITDTKKILNIPHALIFKTGLNRPLLYYEVRLKPKDHNDVIDDMAQTITKNFPGQSGINEVIMASSFVCL